MSTVRRVYFYAVSLVTLGIWAWGAGLILRLIFAMTFNRQPSIASSPGYLQQQLALGIAMIAIAGGDTIREVQRAIFNDADIVIVWREFYKATDETAKIAKEFLKEIK